jgi:ATP-dependent helicase/nuclease subunit A
MSAIIEQASRSQNRAANPQSSVWVGANAGTGKTKVLTDRVLNLLLADTPPERILCLTFTKAAAAEMATRLANRLSQWAVMDQDSLDSELSALGITPSDPQRQVARRLFARLLDVPGGMRIETIHAFCQSLLRRFPLEAGISPHFDVLDDRGAKELMDQAYERVLRQARQDPDSALTTALGHVAGCVSEFTFSKRMADLTGNRGKLRRVLGEPGEDLRVRKALYRHLLVPLDQTPEALLHAAIADLDHQTIGKLADALQHGAKGDQEQSGFLKLWLTQPLEEQSRLWSDFCRVFLTAKGEPRATSKWPSKGAKEAAPDSPTWVDYLTQAVLHISDHHKAAIVAQATAAMLTIGRQLIATYDRAKKQRGMMDFEDLILHTRDLLSRQDATAWVLYKLDNGIDHVMIDEAQDTGPDQWQIISSLTEDFFSGEGAAPERARTVFVVGDRKQSIYSFQGADPVSFDRMYDRYAQRIPESGRTFHNVALDVSFRSVSAVLQVVDKVFEQAPACDGVRHPGEDIRHLPAREGMAGTVELWPLLAPQALGDDNPWKPPVEAIRGESAETRLARLIAKRIKRMITGERLISRDRPIKPGDILVLVRRRSGFVEDLVRALKSEEVPVSGVDRMVLTDQMVVMDLLALGEALILPEDDLTLASVLKSPLIGLDEDQLYAIAQGRSRGYSLWRSLREASQRGAADPIYKTAYQTLRDLMEKADFLPPHELYAHILGPLDGRRKLLGRLGPDAEDPLDEFVQLTLAYDRGHPPSLQNFLHWIRSDDGQLKRDMDEGSNTVRVMTVHGSKGLEAPVVIMPDTRSLPKKPEGVLWDDGPNLMLWAPYANSRCEIVKDLHTAKADAEAEEYRRLLYVGMTRAADHLIVCGWDGKNTAPADCWYNLVAPAVQALGEEVEDPFLATEGPALGLSTTSLWRVQHQQTATPKKDKNDDHSKAEAASSPLPPWTRTAPSAEPSPPRPLAPSRIELPDPPPRSPLDHDTFHGLADGGDPQRRFRRGTLIHRLLQSLPDLPPNQRPAAAAAFLARPVWALSTAQQHALTRETLAVMDEPAFRPLFGPGSLAEVPITGIIGGHVVSGQVDRLIVTDDSILVVDYKTNRPPPHEVEDVAPAYLLQMALYQAVLQTLYPERPVSCALLWTDGPRIMPLPTEILLTHLDTIAPR